MKIVTADGGEKNKPSIRLKCIFKLKQIVYLVNHQGRASCNEQTGEQEEVKNSAQHNRSKITLPFWNSGISIALEFSGLLQ